MNPVCKKTACEYTHLSQPCIDFCPTFLLKSISSYAIVLYVCLRDKAILWGTAGLDSDQWV